MDVKHDTLAFTREEIATLFEDKCGYARASHEIELLQEKTIAGELQKSDKVSCGNPLDHASTSRVRCEHRSAPTCGMEDYVQRVWLVVFVVLLFGITLGLNTPAHVDADSSRSTAAGLDRPAAQLTATATLPPAIATAVPTSAPAPGIVGEGPNMTFMIALVVIAGGAVLLWRRQRPG